MSECVIYPTVWDGISVCATHASGVLEGRSQCSIADLVNRAEAAEAEVESLRAQLDDYAGVVHTARKDCAGYQAALKACAEANDLDLGVTDVWRRVAAAEIAAKEVMVLRAQVQDAADLQARLTYATRAWEHWQAKAEAAEAQVQALPVVAHKGAHTTDAQMFLAAASRLERGYPVGGSNLRDAVVRLIRREVGRALDGPQ